jgi:hypothetical protein
MPTVRPEDSIHTDARGTVGAAGSRPKTQNAAAPTIASAPPPHASCRRNFCRLNSGRGMSIMTLPEGPAIFARDTGFTLSGRGGPDVAAVDRRNFA